MRPQTAWEWTFCVGVSHRATAMRDRSPMTLAAKNDTDSSLIWLAPGAFEGVVR